MTHDDYKDLLTAKALTALETDDARALSAHLEGCAECRSELTVWEDTAAFLCLDAEPVEPSTRLRQQIIARVREEKSSSPAAQKWESPLSPDSKVLPFARPQRDVWASLKSFGAIAAALVFLTLSISVFVLWRQNRAIQTQLAKLEEQRKATQAQLDHERAVLALLTAPDARMAKLAGTPMAPGAHAMLAYDQSGHAMLMAKGLPAAPKGMAYQLWFIKDNKKMPGKVFTTDAAGNGILEDEIPTVARNAAVFAITLEPESGVQVPTGSIYLVSAS